MEEIKERKKEKKKRKIVDMRWISLLFMMALLLTLVFSTATETTIPQAGIVIQILIIITIIIFTVVFDMIGVAVTTADSEVFNSMSAQKVKGSAVSKLVLRNRDKVNSIVSDVIGDVSGIVSGSAGVSIAITLSTSTGIDIFTATLIVTALIAALTISSKAFFKGIALKNRNTILYTFCLVLSIFYKPKSR